MPFLLLPFTFLLDLRMSGIEPPRSLDHGLLRPARLPIPPHPQKLCRQSIYELRRAGVKQASIKLYYPPKMPPKMPPRIPPAPFESRLR